MTGPELDEFLTVQRTCRVATVSPSGPHVTPLWFVWDGSSLWLHSLSRSQRWTDLERDNRVAVVIDTGTEYAELRGAELRGRAVTVGEVPRTGEPDAVLTAVESVFSRKYFGTETMYYDARHAWRRLTPDKITTWDFRKIPAS